jgi:primosomal protein N'
MNEKTIIIHGNMTKLQKIQAFWKIKLGLVETITNRGLFFDWHNLHKIIIHKPTNRSYSSQSDPRFVIQEVAETYKSIYKVSLEYMQ